MADSATGLVKSDKKFKCLHPGCGKTFNRKDYLARHSANHLEVRPFQCPICSLHFARQDLLDKHMFTKAHEKRQKREQMNQLKTVSPSSQTVLYKNSSDIHSNGSVTSPSTQQSRSSQQHRYDLDYPSTDTWAPFSLDSFDISISDHYTWLFGTDFWTDSPPKSFPGADGNEWENRQEHDFLPPIYDVAPSLNPSAFPSSFITQSLAKREENVDNQQSPVQYENRRISVDKKSEFVSENHSFDGLLNLRRNERHSTIEDKGINSETFLKMIDVLKPIPEINAKNAYFSLVSMKTYLNLYWEHFDTLYPILHRPTFDPSVTEPALLVSIVTIGMAYSPDREISNLAIAIHRKFRNIIFLMIEDQPQVQLWVHQTLLLTNYFDKMLGSTVQYDMSQFFHGTNIALMHFSGYLKGLSEPQIVKTEDSVQADKQWHEWVWYEMTKRTAFFAFICDTQHATLFRHSPILSAFEVRLELPSSDACWAAADGIGLTQWRASENKIASNPEEKKINGPSAAGTTQEGQWPSFLYSLKRLIRQSREDQKEFQLATFSQFSCLILLHGLLSVCWDMQWRGLLDMGIVSKRRMTEFKNRLESSFDNWKDYFDYQLSKSNLPPITSTVVIPRNDQRVDTGSFANIGDSQFMNDYYNNSPLLCSNWAMFQLGLMALHVDTMTLRINAGSPNVLGRKIRAVDRENCKKAIRAWARSDDGRLATWHSVQFMWRIAENESLLDQAVHIPWGVYLATLTIWSYEVCQEDDAVPPPVKPHPEWNNKRYRSGNGRNIEYESAKHDAVTYLRQMNSNNEFAPRPDVQVKIDEQEANNNNNNNNNRHQLVIGLIAYSTSLLMHIKWGFVIRGYEVLNNMLREYD
ncbi:fungal-specific transcription factor domain-containing protein [Lipomyces japonicus]|uniref:fungal-specific transcription factor domain-containing protein n=1 Tax=Lipomyces japonicus TaxID=56871 RepID=UPI0034CF217A